MPTVRVSFDNLPSYSWPIHQERNSAGYTLIQATNDEGDHWIPKWVLVDSGGENLAIIEIDDIDPDPEIAAAQAAEAGLAVVQEMHGITTEETGLKCELHRGVARTQAPPE